MLEGEYGDLTPPILSHAPCIVVDVVVCPLGEALGNAHLCHINLIACVPEECTVVSESVE